MVGRHLKGVVCDLRVFSGGAGMCAGIVALLADSSTSLFSIPGCAEECRLATSVLVLLVGISASGTGHFLFSVLEPMNWHEGTGSRLPASTCEQRIHAHTDAHPKSLCDHSGLLWRAFVGVSPSESVCTKWLTEHEENKCVHCAVFQRRWQSDRKPMLATEMFASRGMSVLILDRRGRSDFAAARVCGHSGRGRTQKGGCRRCVCVCRGHATTLQQACSDSVTLTSLWSSRTAEARPTPMHLVDGVRHLLRRCREQDC
ncbi:hypothetical protein TcCL_ESM10019 [Trypanosoma cruzi]|nr:hypothetical protein TcCL_ESM10019 [Trypanosoma cruzi]